MADRKIHAGDDIESGFLVWKVAHKRITFVAGTTGAVATHIVFNVTGDVVLRAAPGVYCKTTLTDVGNAATFAMGTTNALTTFFSNQDTDNILKGTCITNNAGTVIDSVSPSKVLTYIHEDADIVYVVGGEAITGGVVDIQIIWAALSDDGDLVIA